VTLRFLVLYCVCTCPFTQLSCAALRRSEAAVLSFSSLGLGLELFSLDYIEVNQPSKLIDQSGFSVCSHSVNGIGYVERMVSIASQMSGVKAWELARDIMCLLLDKICCAPSHRQPQL